MPKVNIELSEKEYNLLLREGEIVGDRHTVIAKRFIVDKLQNPLFRQIEVLTQDIESLLNIRAKIVRGDYVTDKERESLDQWLGYFCDVKDGESVIYMIRQLVERMQILRSWLKHDAKLMGEYTLEKNNPESSVEYDDRGGLVGVQNFVSDVI